MTESNIALGQRVRSKRHELKLTLDDLAKRSGVARTTISKIERDIISPSFNTLAKIARGMGLKITQLISDEQGEEPVVVRKKDRAILEFNGLQCKVENLTSILDNVMLEVIELTLEGGKNIGVDPPHPGEEFLLCQQGTVEFQIGENTYILQKGDAIHFKPNENTCLLNNSSRQAKVLWAYTPPRLAMRGNRTEI